MSDNPYAVETSELPSAICIGSIKLNYSFIFGNDKMSEVGRLNFNGDKMEFTGDADESAKVFIGLVAHCFQERLREEFKKGMNRAAEIAKDALQTQFNDAFWKTIGGKDKTYTKDAKSVVLGIANAIRKEASNDK